MSKAKAVKGRPKGSGAKEKSEKAGKAAKVFHKVIPGLTSLLVPVSSLVADESNARFHDERNIVAIAKSLDRFGQHAPFVLSKSDGVVRVGNGRLEAVKLLGWTHVAAVVIEESRLASVGRAIADNRTGELSEWDFELLEKAVGDLTSAGIDLSELGWTDEELKSLAKGLPPPRQKFDGDGNPVVDDKAEFVISFPIGKTDEAIALAEVALTGLEEVEIKAGDNVVKETL